MFANLHQLSHHAAWRRQLEMLLESTGEGIYGVDLKGRCIFINGAGAQMLGYTPDEILGRNMHFLIHHSHANHDLMPLHDCRIFKAFEEGQGCRVEDEVLWRRDQTSFPAEYASYPILDGQCVVGAVVTFSDISERKSIEAALKKNHVQLEQMVKERTAELRQAHEATRRLSAHLNSVREEERAHIAREIHDEQGACLTALQLDLNWLKQRLGSEAEFGPHVDRMLEIATVAMGSVRRILNDLRPGVLDHSGLWAALEYLLQDFQMRTGLNCSFVCPADVERCRLGREAEIAIYRIAQEVLTNVQRHARASSVRLRAHASKKDLLIELKDDGQGMQVPANPTSFGLLGMRERALALGGELTIRSRDGCGTTVTLLMRRVLS
ncbi:hypothetical protein BH11PSE11_BH11PSE11_13230 [soil metagenome]